jgi:hypothetical protein
MYATEIVPSEVQCQHRIEFFPFLRKSIGQSSESPHLHSHRQILAFDMRSANLSLIGVAENGNLFAADAFGWGVACFAIGSRGIQFNQLCELYPLRPQTENNGVLIGSESVCRNLKAALCGRSEFFCESYCVPFGASPQVPSEYQFAVALDGNKRPRIANRDFTPALHGLGFFLHFHISPKFIALHVFDSQAVDAIHHQLFAFLASQGQEVQDRLWMHASNSGSAANRASFHQMLQYAHSLCFGQDHAAKGLRLRLNKGNFANCAAISLLTLSVFTELLSRCIACLAVHFLSSLLQHSCIAPRKHRQVKSVLLLKKNRGRFNAITPCLGDVQ